jgi:acetyltransferase EpsM|uniref:PglD N-terminal domain-containing protein n=1 Tax=viral metagenome TaxID=1070528 RepID=A0A6C0IVL0_9ZZZZ
MEIILIGGGGNCKKIIDMIMSEDINIKGILDDKYTDIQINFYRKTKIIGKISDLIKYKDCNIIVTIGSIDFRKDFFNKYIDYKFPNLIHTKSCISESSQLGKGIVIHYGVYVGPDVIIGDFCHLDTNSIIEHDCNLGNNIMVCPGVNICGGVKIRDNVFIGAGTTIINSTSNKEIILNQKCYIGAGSLITKSIESNKLYYGNSFNYILKDS